MKKVLLVLAALAFVAGTASAGPNADGTLIVHDPGIEFTFDIVDYCGMNPLDHCLNADVRIDGGLPWAWKVYAAFPDAASPRLKAVTFGIDYNVSGYLYLSGQGMCGDFEVVTSGWPAPGEGTGMTFNETQLGNPIEIYWFGGYVYGGAVDQFALIPHPTQGANFADDSVPAVQDPIADLGILGFGQDGYLPCPVEEEGACCLEDGSCIITLASQCPGLFLGGVCDPNPCPEPGACCFDEVCVLLPEWACELEGGLWVGGPCDPNPCVIPVEESTWGQIKANYR